MEKSKVKRKIFLTALLYIGIGLLLLQTVGSTSYQLYKKEKEKKQYQQELSDLKDKEDELQATVNKLQDPDYVARYAREKYLYSKDGEIIIRIPE